MTEFGKLETVPVQEGWPLEASDFTPWLARPENLKGLGDELALEIVFVEIESQVGPFRADILARHKETGDLIVIENQYGNTDHKHLGQLLTYAAGVGQDGSGAKTVVWIAERFNERHRAVLDWLNKCTDPGIRFFGVELQLWKIGSSAPAPKFQVVCRPNGWQKNLTHKTAGPSTLPDLYQEFWNDFITFCGESTIFQFSIAPARHWLPVYAIRSGIGVNLTVSKLYATMSCQLWIESKNAKAVFDALAINKDAINASLSHQLEYDRKEGKNPCSIFQYLPCDITNKAEWPAMHAWLKERGEAYVQVFSPLVKAAP